MIKKLNVREAKTSNADVLDSIEANAKAILDKVAAIRKGGLDDYNSSLLKKQKKALIDVNSALSNVASYASAYVKEDYDWKDGSKVFNNIYLYAEGENGLVGEDYSYLEGHLKHSTNFELTEYGTVGGGVPEVGKLGYAVWQDTNAGFEIYVEYQWDKMYGRKYVGGEIVKSSITEFEPFGESISKRMQKKSVTEGDVSKKTNYAVQVRDMNKALIHLFTGTKADCERLEKQIDDFLRWAEYDCENEEEYMFEEEWLLGEMEKFGHISEIAEREIDERNNYYDYSTGKTYHIINDYFFDLYL